MITPEQYKKVKRLVDMFANKEKINGADFIAVYNEVFKRNANFSTCCPSENRNLFNQMRAQARQFEIENKKAALTIVAELQSERPPKPPINDEGVNERPTGPPPAINEETPPDEINDEGVNNPRPNTKPKRETRGRKRKTDINKTK